MKKPLKIGITGGIGSGKSIICKVFGVLGAPIYDSDSRAKVLMTTDLELIRSVQDAFGSESYVNGQLNREFLAEQVFTNSEKLAHLNSLVHPAVGRDFQHWMEAQAAPYVIKEAALLFEIGSYKALDQTLLVTAPESMRVQRVLARDPHRSARDVENIMKKQWRDEKKAQLADEVLVNDGRKLLLPQILQLHEQFILT